MRVCVSSMGDSLESQVDARFGRCPFFLIIDTETMHFEAVPNSNISAAHGAGIGAAQLIANKAVEAVITGQMGPNAYRVLSMAGIKIFTGVRGTAKEAIEKLRTGGLSESMQPTVPGHFGAGRGTGQGMGMGGGRGMGRGGGINIGAPQSSSQLTVSQKPSGYPPMNRMKTEDELSALEKNKEKLEDELEGLKARIKELQDSKK